MSLLLLWMLSCGTPTEEPGCDLETPCGWGETCVAGECVAGICATSQQCAMEFHCSEAGECEPGCETDRDCYPGDRCGAEGQCEAEACTDTHLDCEFREYCNTTTGDCYDAGEQFCRWCTYDNECGEGNYCFARSCGVDCSTTPCPSGFDCVPFTNDQDEIVAYQCITYCWLHEGADTQSLDLPDVVVVEER